MVKFVFVVIVCFCEQWAWTVGVKVYCKQKNKGVLYDILRLQYENKLYIINNAGSCKPTWTYDRAKKFEIVIAYSPLC